MINHVFLQCIKSADLAVAAARRLISILTPVLGYFTRKLASVLFLVPSPLSAPQRLPTRTSRLSSLHTYLTFGTTRRETHTKHESSLSRYRETRASKTSSRGARERRKYDRRPFNHLSRLLASIWTATHFSLFFCCIPMQSPDALNVCVCETLRALDFFSQLISTENKNTFF